MSKKFTRKICAKNAQHRAKIAQNNAKPLKRMYGKTKNLHGCEKLALTVPRRQNLFTSLTNTFVLLHLLDVAYEGPEPACKDAAKDLWVQW